MSNVRCSDTSLMSESEPFYWLRALGNLNWRKAWLELSIAPREGDVETLLVEVDICVSLSSLATVPFPAAQTHLLQSKRSELHILAFNSACFFQVSLCLFCQSHLLV